MFLTNDYPDPCVLTLCIEIRQNNLYLASLPRISANLNENYRRYNFHALANISGKFTTLMTILYREAQCLCQDNTLVSEQNLYNHECTTAIIYIRYTENNHKHAARCHRIKATPYSAILMTISQHTHS